MNFYGQTFFFHLIYTKRFNCGRCAV